VYACDLREMFEGVVAIRLVNNQLSGAWGSQIELIDFLLGSATAHIGLTPYLVGLAAGFELRID
jgi:hypothetical protein